MIISLLFPIAIVALVVFGVRALRERQSDVPLGQQIRNVFLYLVLLVLLLASVSGLAGLLGMVADRADLVVADSSELALNLSLLLVGGPLLIAFGLWTRKRVQRDPTETSSAGWTLFVTVALITTLVVTLFGVYSSLRFIFRATDYDGFAVAQAVVWGLAWFCVDRLDRQFAPTRRANFRHVVVAAIGLSLSTVAIAQLITAILDRLVWPGTLNALIVNDAHQFANAVALSVIGAAVWVRYWLMGLASAPSSDGWRLYVVLLGAAGGLITAIISSATMLYSIAVWILGSPVDTDAADHFESLPSQIGALVVGVLVWWYHRTTLAHRPTTVRKEVDRTYTYLMALGGLIAAAVGVVILLSAFVEALTGGAVIAGDPALNTLLLAIVLLAIGIPVWWVHWRAASLLYSVGDADEIESVSRRVYLITLVGVGGLVALGTGIATVYLVLRDLIDTNVSSSTFRSLRFPLATLLTSGLIALYHFGIYQRDHATQPDRVPKATTRQVILVGPFDAAIEEMVLGLGPANVRWIVTVGGSWSIDEVRTLLLAQAGDTAISLTPSGAFGAVLSTS